MDDEMKEPGHRFDPEATPRFLRDFGARHGNDGREEVSKIFGKAADRIDWLERRLLASQHQVITLNVLYGAVQRWGHAKAYSDAFGLLQAEHDLNAAFKELSLRGDNGSSK